MKSKALLLGISTLVLIAGVLFGGSADAQTRGTIIEYRTDGTIEWVEIYRENNTLQYKVYYRKDETLARVVVYRENGTLEYMRYYRTNQTLQVIRAYRDDETLEYISYWNAGGWGLDRLDTYDTNGNRTRIWDRKRWFPNS